MYGGGDDPMMMRGPIPRLRRERGLWHCGHLHEHEMLWAWGETPAAAYELWCRSRSRS